MRPPQVAALAAVGLCALGTPPGARADAWDAEPPLLRPRRLLTAAVEGGKIYTFGGCGSPCFPQLHTSTREERRLEVFDPDAPPDHAWSVREKMPAILSSAAAAAPGNGKIYLFGGFVTRNATWEYLPQIDDWRPKEPMPTGRYGLAAVALGGKVYVLGGSDGRAPSRALEIYDPATNRWEQGSPMPTARVYLAAAAAGGKIYAIGGSADCCGDRRTDAVEVYDPTTNHWRAAAPLPVALQTSAAATAANGKIYVFGGFIPGDGVQDSIFELDPARGTWTTKQTRLPFPPRDQAPAVALGSGIHLLGGSTDCHCRALPDHDRYEPDRELEADLRITKENGLAQVFPRQAIRYEIVVTNVGDVAALGAAVTDSIPAELTGATWVCLPSGGAVRTRPCPGPRQRLDDRVDLPVGGKVTYRLKGTVAPTAAGLLRNCAQVETPAGVQRACDSDPVRQCPVPAITKTDHRTTAAPGDVLSYVIALTNLCPAELPVTVTDVVSTVGQIPVSCPGVEPPPLPTGTSVTLPPSATVTCSATATVPGTLPCACEVDPITNTATVTLADGRFASATDTDLIPSLPAPDLDVAITTPPDVHGCDLPRTITVANHGPGTACEVVLDVATSGDFALESLSSPCAGGPPCELGPIGPDEKVVVTAFLEPAPGAKCPAVGTLTASAESVCPAPGDRDEANAGIQVLCDLAVTKTDGQEAAAPGDPILYTITVANVSCVTVPDAKVEDFFPPEIDGVQWCQGVNCTPAEPPPLADALPLEPGASETYLASGTISPLFLGTLCNTASVAYAGDGDDPTPGDNNATDCTEVDLPGPGPGPINIPAASDYGLAALALLLAAFALMRLRRARVA